VQPGRSPTGGWCVTCSNQHVPHGEVDLLSATAHNRTKCHRLTLTQTCHDHGPHIQYRASGQVTCVLVRAAELYNLQLRTRNTAIPHTAEPSLAASAGAQPSPSFHDPRRPHVLESHPKRAALLSPAIVSDGMLSSPTPPSHFASILQPATLSQVVIFES